MASLTTNFLVILIPEIILESTCEQLFKTILEKNFLQLFLHSIFKRSKYTEILKLSKGKDFIFKVFRLTPTIYD